MFKVTSLYRGFCTLVHSFVTVKHANLERTLFVVVFQFLYCVHISIITL